MRGGYGSSSHGSLEDRIRRAVDPVAQPGVAADPPSPARHCLVDGQPSLLVEWRRAEGSWEGRVVSVLWLDGQGWAVVERWLTATQIRSV